MTPTLSQGQAEPTAIELAKAALADLLNGWKYIRSTHGDLYGVGWDRAQDRAEHALSALAASSAAPTADLRAASVPVAVLRQHWLRAMECDHAEKRDKPHCACSLTDLGWHPSIGGAIEAWLEHVHAAAQVAAVAAPPAQPVAAWDVQRKVPLEWHRHFTEEPWASRFKPLFLAAVAAPKARPDDIRARDAARWQWLVNSFSAGRRRIWNHVLDDEIKSDHQTLEAAIDAARLK